LQRAAFLKASPHSRAKIVRVKVYPGVFYGIEASDCTDKQMATLSSAVIDFSRRKITITTWTGFTLPVLLGRILTRTSRLV
jgi:hypothetical protein